MFTTTSIIDNLNQDKSIDYKKLCRALKLSKKDDKAKLEIALNALEELEIIRKTDSKAYVNNINNTHLTAKIRCSSKGYCFAVREGSNDDIYIRENLLNYAWNGDKVLVRIIKEGVKRRSPEGIVDCILERNNKILLAKVEVIDELVYGIPIDDRILSRILLPKEDIKYIHKNSEKNIVRIEIDIFPIGQLEGKGHVINELKLESNEEIDNDFVLAKNNIYPTRNKNELSIKKPEINERLNLNSSECFMFNNWRFKKHPLVPIFNVEKDKKGQIKLWIHANSIAERIDFNSRDLNEFFNLNLESYPLSKEWDSFLGDKILKSAEFRVGEENEAVSLCLTLSPTMEIIDWSFHLTYVKCSLKLDEKQVEALVNRKSKTRITSKTLKPIKDYIEQLDLFIEISRKFRKKKIEDGKFEISRLNKPIDSINEYHTEIPGEYCNDYFAPLNERDSNTYISPIIYEADSIWFQHSLNCKLINAAYTPQEFDYINTNELIKQSNLINNDIELDDEGTSSLKKVFSSCKDENKTRILNKYLINTIRSNEAIVLDGKDEASKINSGQAPWTMGSYDYVNLINQFSIYNLISNGKRSNKGSKEIDLLKKGAWKSISWNLINTNSQKLINKLFNELLIEKCNENKIKLKQYKSNMINIKQIREAEKLIGEGFKGLITTVQSYGFFVELPTLSIEGLVHVSTLNDDWYEYRSRQNMLVGRKSKNTYRVGDLIDIKIIKVDILKYQIDLEIIEEN